MTIGTILLLAFAVVAAFLITLARVVKWRTILRYSAVIDVVFTITVGVFMGATLTGVLIAVLAGLVLAVFFSVIKWLQCGLDALGKHFKHDYDSEFDAQGRWIYNKAPYV